MEKIWKNKNGNFRYRRKHVDPDECETMKHGPILRPSVCVSVKWMVNIFAELVEHVLWLALLGSAKSNRTHALFMISWQIPQKVWEKQEDPEAEDTKLSTASSNGEDIWVGHQESSPVEFFAEERWKKDCRDKLFNEHSVSPEICT